MEFVIAGIVFLLVVLLTYPALTMIFSEEQKVTRRLRRMSDYESAQARQVEPLLNPFRIRILEPLSQSVRSIGSALAPRGYSQAVRHKLMLAGNPNGMEVGRFVATKILGATAVLGLFIAGTALRPLTSVTWVLIVVPLVALAFFGPDLWLSGRVSSRKLAMRRALPDMLDMLTISVEAGLGFDQALAKLVRNTNGPLAEEFGRVLQEIQAGSERSEALRHLSARAEVPELNGFIMAIVQADVFGVSVSSVLRTQAVEMRMKRRQLAEETAQKAPVKLVFPLVLCILPATLIVILGPAAITFMRVF
ncbi:MAG: type II secretion system F family protein [Coriobacteriia bacterium]